MDTILTIVMIVIFLFVTNVMDKKKEKAKRTDFPGVPPIPRRQPKLPPPMPQPWPRSERERTTAAGQGSKQIDFEIPDLKRAPSSEHGRMYQEKGAVLAEQAERYAQDIQEKNKYMTYLEQKKRTEAEERAEEQAAYEQQTGLKARASEHEPMDVQPTAMAHAVAYAMLLDKPKAYETMRRYGGFRRT